MRCAALCSMTKSELMKLLNRLVCESWARGSGREGWLRRREPTSFRPVRPFLRSAPSPATSPAFGPFAFYRRLFLSPLAGGGPGRIVEGSADRDAPADASSFSVSLASARVFFLPSRSQSFPCRRRSLDSSVLSLLAHALFPSRRLFRFASFTHSILSLSLFLSREKQESAPLFSLRGPEFPPPLRHAPARASLQAPLLRHTAALAGHRGEIACADDDDEGFGVCKRERERERRRKKKTRGRESQARWPPSSSTFGSRKLAPASPSPPNTYRPLWKRR